MDQGGWGLPGRTPVGAGPLRTRPSAQRDSAPVAPCPGPGRRSSRHWWWRRCAGPPTADQSASLISRRRSGCGRLWRTKEHLMCAKRGEEFHQKESKRQIQLFYPGS